MFINESEIDSGVNAVSVVSDPAIESNFIALNNHKLIELAEVSKERKELIGAALIPDKPILRVDNEGKEYYIYFSKDTIRQARELFAKRKYSDKATLEHKQQIEGMTVVESWIKEDEKYDKSNFYGLNVPVGTWLISMKADNEEIYQKAKKGEVKGFSIEGIFAEQKKQKPVDATLQMLKQIQNELGYGKK